MDKIKIKLLCDLPYGQKKGETLDLDKDIAKQLINEKRAEAYKPKPTTSKAKDKK